MMQSNNRSVSAKSVVLYILFGFLFALSAAVFGICIWYQFTFAVDFRTLLYVLSSPLQGTGSSTVRDILAATVPAAVGAALIYTALLLLLELRLSVKRKKLAAILKRIGAVLCCLSLIASLVFSVHAFGVLRYLTRTEGEMDDFYEAYYIDPEKVSIAAKEETKNLLYIYVESLESTYASEADGGRQSVNYMPRLTALAEEHVSFTEKEDGSLGGFVSLLGTGWTVAALLATSSGIPFAFPLGENGHNSMSRQTYFASGLTTIGDILEGYGYRQVFLCGSDAAFGGRDKYYAQHGNYEIYDLADARKDGVVAADYHNGFWGIEDYILFDIAKTELTELAAEGDPFNFTMLTVDGHHNGGFTCKYCGNDYEELSAKNRQTANVVTCTDKLLYDFIGWCMAQDWYEDTVIVITGDHPRMDTRLVSGVPFMERTVYNCFINSAKEPVSTDGRVITSFDMFPTTLSAMGFDIIGDRLGLGTDLFSPIPTYAEEFGLDMMETEIQKESPFYVATFSPELMGLEPAGS